MLQDTERARQALQAIPASIERSEWVRALMAARAAGIDEDTARDWCAQADSYEPRAFRDTWRSLAADGGIGPGTLFYMAKQHGWQGAGKATSTRRKPLQRPRKGSTAAEVWARCAPATQWHVYIQRKHAAGVPLDGLRVLPVDDALRIGGQAMAGALVVPGYGPAGKLQTLQLIPPDGPKMNLPGHPMTDARFTVGTPEPDAPLYLCEGIGAAWACWQATGHAAVCCFGWHNVGKVAADLRQKDRAARLVLVPDIGKEADGDKIAQTYGCLVAKLPEGLPDNYDVGDYLQAEDGDALALLLEAASEPPQPEPLLQPVDVAGVITNPSPPPAFVWEGYAPRGVVTLLGAHGGTGKSTIALMLAVAAALGRPLFSVPTVQARVLFASLEDAGQVVRWRLKRICNAWAINPQELAGRLQIVEGTENPELFAAENRGAGDTTPTYAELRKLAQGAGLVVVDNASDAYGADEIQRRQVRAFIRCLAEIAKAEDAAVLLLAHVDKNTSRARKAEGGEGYSGSTAWHNSVRSRLFMTRDKGDTLRLEHQKSNFAKLREPLKLDWPEGGLPQLAALANTDGLTLQAQIRADDTAAAVLLNMLAEFESRQQYASPSPTARNNPHALLRGEHQFKRLGLKPEDTRRIVNMCQREGWLQVTTYRTSYRKELDRWAVTPEGTAFATHRLGKATAPTAPTALT